MKFTISRQDMHECHQRILPYIHRTPVLQSSLLDELVGCSVFFKCENFQKAGAYKMRGALNAILQLSEEKRAKGVTTHSSGNFAQALAKAAHILQVPAYIVMPENAPKVKVAGVRQYGGEVIFCAPTLAAREEKAHSVVAEREASFLHPSNDLPVITGQGTAAMELIEEFPDLNAIITPVGGGGLLAGSALAAHYYSPALSIYGAEPLSVDDAFRSLQSGKIEDNDHTHTIADGLKTKLGNNNFPIIKALTSNILRVSEQDILTALQLTWERMKIIIEPSSAVGLAAIINNNELFSDQKVGVIISGGNVDIQAQILFYQNIIDSFINK